MGNFSYGATDVYRTYYSDIPHEWIPIICHPDRVSFFDYNGITIPCISLDIHRYDEILKCAMGRRGLFDTNLDIFDNLEGRVFVRMTVTVPPAAKPASDTSASVGGRRHTLDDTHPEVFLLNARLHLDFFKAMADATMFGLRPEYDHDPDADKITLVQLPRPDKTLESLKLIQRGLGVV